MSRELTQRQSSYQLLCGAMKAVILIGGPQIGELQNLIIIQSTGVSLWYRYNLYNFEVPGRKSVRGRVRVRVRVGP